MGEKGLVCELGLVLLLDPVSGLMVAYFMTMILSISCVSARGKGEKVTDVCGQHMYTLTWQLLNVGVHPRRPRSAPQM